MFWMKYTHYNKIFMNMGFLIITLLLNSITLSHLSIDCLQRILKLEANKITNTQKKTLINYEKR